MTKINKSNAYLYGEDVEVPQISMLVIARRIELLQDKLEELLDHSYHTRDSKRCNAIIKAIDFWDTLNDA